MQRKSLKRNLLKNIKTDSKSFFKYIRDNSKTKDSVGPLKNDNGDIVSTNEDMVEELNGFFSSVFTKENTSDIPDAPIIFSGDSASELQDCLISRDQVLAKLQRLEPYKAMGPDRISSYLLKHLSDELALPFSILFNKMSLRELCTR